MGFFAAFFGDGFFAAFFAGAAFFAVAGFFFGAAGLSLAEVTTSIAALPITTPSTRPRSALTCEGSPIPKPRATGSDVCARTRSTNDGTSDPSAERAPVTPVSDTQ